jgi:Bacterial PH domain
MRRWRPQLSGHRWIALLLLALTLTAIILPATQLLQIFAGPPEGWAISLRMFWWALLLIALVLVAFLLLYRTIAAFTLAYELDRNGLYILWAGNRAVIPLDQVASLEVGITVEPTLLSPLKRIGYHWGSATSDDQRAVQLFTTLPPERSMVVHTASASYVISPADPEQFAQEFEQRRNLGATKPLSAAIETGRLFLYSFWSDPTVRSLLLTALILNLIGLAALTWRYPDLAAALEMRFDPTGQVVDMRPRHQVLFLPLAAFGLTLVNLALGVALYRRETLSARLLQGASVTVQILFVVAIVTIIR